MTERAPRELDPWRVRYAEWTGLSHRLERFELFMAVFAQNLGRRDRDLNVREDEYARNRSEARAIEDPDAVTETLGAQIRHELGSTVVCSLCVSMKWSAR